MSSNSEHEQGPTESTGVSNSNEKTDAETGSASAIQETKKETTETSVAPTEERKSASSWFPTLTIPPNFTSQLNTFSSSFLQVTSKVSAAATTLVQKTLPQRPSTPPEDQPKEFENVETASAAVEEKLPEENNETFSMSKDLTSIFNDLSSTVIKGAQQLKQAVEEKSLLGNFSKEHEKFLTEKRTQQRREEAAVPPWIGYVEEEETKNQILALSKEKRNFLRSPPAGANFYFDMAAAYPVAMATLEVDENLKQMRFELVPKQINEETFWCNYFYRVSLIKQSTQLSALTQEKPNLQSNEETRAQNQARNRTTSESQEKNSDVTQDFVSEDYDTSAVSMDEIRREIEELTVPKKNADKRATNKAGSPDESEWDKSLADELDNVTAEELEAQINQMLASDHK